MGIKHTRLRPLIIAYIIAITTSSCVNETLLTQEEREIFLKSAPRYHTNPDKREPIYGYPVRKRRIGGPTDVEWDLDNSFPKSGSLLEMILGCEESQ